MLVKHPGVVQIHCREGIQIVPEQKYPAEQRERALRITMNRLREYPAPCACGRTFEPQVRFSPVVEEPHGRSTYGG